MGPSGLGGSAGIPQAMLSALLCPHPCSDDEKSRQMWRRYQEREDSRISGEQGWAGRAGLGWERGWEPGVSPCSVPPHQTSSWGS